MKDVLDRATQPEDVAPRAVEEFVLTWRDAVVRST
jgi:hypothetical protein